MACADTAGCLSIAGWAFQRKPCYLRKNGPVPWTWLWRWALVLSLCLCCRTCALMSCVAPAGLSFGKAVAAMLALKERSAPGCAGRDPVLRRQRELLLNIRLADVFGMQVKAPRKHG